MYKIKRLNKLEEKEFSRKSDLESLMSKSNGTLLNIMKCIEFYYECPNDLYHWAVNIHDRLLNSYNIFGTYSVLFIKVTNGAEYNNLPADMKELSPSNCIGTKYISLLKDRMMTETEGGIKKYEDLVNTAGGFKYTNEDYIRFYHILPNILDGYININSIDSTKLWSGSLINYPISVKRKATFNAASNKSQIVDTILEFSKIINEGL